jgi:Putative peptidoglycan binding domain
MLASGTLAELDVASIAATTSLGRSSLRLEIRAASGEPIGSLVLKAGRIVFAMAGALRGRDALRVIMSAGSDARFQLTRELLDFELASMVASVDELGTLARVSTGATRVSVRGGETTRTDLPSARRRTAPAVTARALMLEGQLAEIDLVTLLQGIGLGRQFVEIELRDRAGMPRGAIQVKGSKIVSARAGDASGVPALSELIGARDCVAFAAFHIAGDAGQLPVLATISEAGVRLAPASDPRDRTVVEGSLSEFDIPTILYTLGSSRQYYALEVHGEHGTAGTIVLKAGIVQSATAGSFTGLRAIQHLIASHPRDRFRLVQLAGELPEQVPLGPVGHVLLSVDAPAPSTPVIRSHTASGAPPRAPTHAPDGHAAPLTAAAAAPSAAPSAAPEPVLMEGKLSDFDVRTVLEVLAATRQHARLQILDAGQPPLGEIALKAGQIISGRAGSLQGRNAIVFLLGASRQLWFRVVTGSPDLASQEPLGSIRELLAGIQIGGVRRPDAAARALRWAIPLAFLLGGAIVFVLVRGRSGPSAEPRAAPVSRPAPATAPTEEGSRDRAPPATNPAQPAPASADSQRGSGSGSSLQLTEVPAAPAAPPSGSQTSPAPAPARRSIGVSIQNAQTALQRLGYDPGPIDNAYGPQTRNAIMKFQRSQHLPATGVLDRDTWSAIVGQLMP